VHAGSEVRRTALAGSPELLVRQRSSRRRRTLGTLIRAYGGVAGFGDDDFAVVATQVRCGGSPRRIRGPRGSPVPARLGDVRGVNDDPIVNIRVHNDLPRHAEAAAPPVGCDRAEGPVSIYGAIVSGRTELAGSRAAGWAALPSRGDRLERPSGGRETRADSCHSGDLECPVGAARRRSAEVSRESGGWSGARLAVTT
jgi:hypothetical protein